MISKWARVSEWKCVETGGGGGINSEFGINGLKTTLYKIDNQKGPTI